MSTTGRYKSTRDLPGVIPVFPLRGAILLPRATLPLNIFEPRYLALFDDILRTDRLVVIVQPARAALGGAGSIDPADAESPDNTASLRHVGGIGRLTSFQELEDGRLIVSLAGVVRCTLGSEIASTKPYRMFQVSAEHYVGDLQPGFGEGDVKREQLLATLKRFIEARNLKADWSSISRAPTEVLINSLSLMSPYGAEEKQALLEAETLKARAEMLIALAEMDLAGGGSPGSTLQ